MKMSFLDKIVKRCACESVIEQTDMFCSSCGNQVKIKTYKSYLITSTSKEDFLEELDEYLNDGWKIVSHTTNTEQDSRLYNYHTSTVFFTALLIKSW